MADNANTVKSSKSVKYINAPTAATSDIITEKPDRQKSATAQAVGKSSTESK